MKFSEMTYTRPDIDALLADCKALAAKAAAAPDGDALVAVYYEQSRAFADYTTASQLANIHYTCDTRDASWKAEQDFFDANSPAVANAQVEISRAFLSNPHVDALTEHFGTTCVAGMKNAVLGMDDRTVELQKEFNALVSQYQQIYGGALVELDGKQLTIPQLGPYKEDLDPAVRRAAYEAEAGYFDAHRAELDDLYGKIVKNLNQQAHVLGYKDYSELSYVRMNRIGYGAKEIKAFRDQVANDVVPLLQKVMAMRAKRTGIKHPTFAWDKRNISADYTKVDEAIAAAKAIDGSHYTNYDAVEAAVNAVDRNKSVLEQADVDKMAKDIRDAIDALVKKSNSSSSGGGSSTPRYAVTVPDKTENGSLSVSSKNAKRGSDVTITATPDKDYEVDDIVAKDAKGNKLTLKDNGDGTYTFTMPASKVTVTAAFAEKKADEPVAPEKLFADVSAEEYYYEAVKWASENGVTGGIGENLFGANLPCTRAQIVTFLWRAAGSPEPKGMSGFVDVSADAYYAKAVAWAVEQGIVSGTSATTFNPDAVCTRAQSVAFLYRAFGEKVNKAAGFSDVSADAYYADAVAWAVENGVASGIGGGLFAPDQDCARGQIVAFLYRAYQNK